MALRPEEITSILKQEIKDYDAGIKMESTGIILSIGDGIARVYGLDDCMAGELLEFPHGMPRNIRKLMRFRNSARIYFSILVESHHILF